MLAEIYHYDPRLGELLERLEDVDVQPWVALREALVAVREARRWRSCRSGVTGGFRPRFLVVTR